MGVENEIFKEKIDLLQLQLKEKIESYRELEQRYLDLIQHSKELQEKAGKYDIIIQNFKLSDDTKEFIK